MEENVILAIFCAIPILCSVLLYLFFRRYKVHTKPNHRILRLVIGNGLVLLWLLSFLVLAGEIRYRFFYDTTDSFALTKTTQRWFQRHVQLNQRGVRDTIDYGNRKPPGTRRISFLGDSFTAAHGVANVEDRFVNRIRKSRPEWEIHAFALHGWDTGHILEGLQATRDANYELDTVVLVYCLNDTTDIDPQWQAILERIKADRPASGFLVDHSFLFNTLYYRYRASRDPDISNYYHFVLDNYSGPIWEAQQSRLKELHDEVRSRGGTLLVVTFPFLHALGEDYEYKTVHDRLDDFWRSQQAAHLDLYPTYAPHRAAELVVNPYDAHPNEALQISPDYAEAHNNWGNTLQDLGRYERAIAHYQEALRIKPDLAQAHNNWGNVLKDLRRFEEAIAHYQMALRIKPDFAEAHNNLAWLLATCPEDAFRDGKQALDHAERAVELVGDNNAAILDSLSAAYAELGDFQQAVLWQQKAVQKAGKKIKDDLAARLKLYEQDQPYRESH